MTKTFFTSTRFLPGSTTPLSKYASGRGASCTRAHRRLDLVSFLTCCHEGVRSWRRCGLATTGLIRRVWLVKLLAHTREMGPRSRRKRALAWRKAREEDAMIALERPVGHGRGLLLKLQAQKTHTDHEQYLTESRCTGGNSSATSEDEPIDKRESIDRLNRSSKKGEIENRSPQNVFCRLTGPCCVLLLDRQG